MVIISQVFAVVRTLLWPIRTTTSLNIWLDWEQIALVQPRFGLLKQATVLVQGPDNTPVTEERRNSRVVITGRVASLSEVGNTHAHVHTYIPCAARVMRGHAYRNRGRLEVSTANIAKLREQQLCGVTWTCALASDVNHR